MVDPHGELRSIDGIEVHDLTTHRDDRGDLTELYRSDRTVAPPFLQWNVVTSRAGSLRGMHCHVGHSDHLCVIDGELVLGLHDLRPGSPTEGSGVVARLGARTAAVTIPPGVAHGFCFERPTTYVYGLSAHWSLEAELGCRWDDPELALVWPAGLSPILSPRDRDAGPLAEMRDEVRRRLSGGHGDRPA